jgi:hypothetical protein
MCPHLSDLFMSKREGSFEATREKYNQSRLFFSSHSLDFTLAISMKWYLYIVTV